MDIGGKLISPTPLQGLHKYPLNICELFWYVKMENVPFRKTPQNGHMFFTTTVKYIFRKIAHYTIQRVNCVLGYSKIKPFKTWLI